MKKKLLLVLFLLVTIAIDVYVVPILWTTNKQDYKVDDSIIAKIENEEDTTEEETNVIEDLKTEYNNNDIVGVLTINNADYSTVVTQTNDNSYYLNHSVTKEKDRLGTPFLDYRIDINNTRKLLIFAHNSRYRSMPFEILENYYDKSYYDEHKYLTLTTEEKTNTYEIFSVYVEVEDFDYYDLNFSSNKAWLKHLTKLKNNSMYDTGVEINENDNIIILQTCSTLSKYSSYKHKFLVVIGKLVS